MTRIAGVLDPLSGARVDVEGDPPAGAPAPTEGPVDGRALWALPGLYDADQNWPVPSHGLRLVDRWRALAGGAAHVNTAYPWDRIAPSTPSAVAASFDTLRFPQVFPVLTVPRDRSAGFAGWLREHGDEVRETWPPVCRFFSGDPELPANLEAAWAAGLGVAVFCGDDDAVDAVVAARAGPLHFRHATSAAALDRMGAAGLGGHGATAQTSPHFLLSLLPGVAATLHVRPPVPGGHARRSLVDALDRVALIATDHNGLPPGHEGPGLDVAATFLPTLLTLADEARVPLADLLPKVTSAPAAVFGTAGRLAPSRVVVDPSEAPVVAGFAGEGRNPYVGRRLRGRVVAVETAGELTFT